MKIALKLASNGRIVSGWDTGTLVADRDHIGVGETFEVIVVEADPPPQPEPTPPQPPVNGSNEDFFMACVSDAIQRWKVPDGIPQAQQVLLDLFNPEKDGQLLAAGWSLTPANAAGDRTKVLPLGGVWTRVGFGEGHWVWIEQ